MFYPVCVCTCDRGLVNYVFSPFFRERACLLVSTSDWSVASHCGLLFPIMCVLCLEIIDIVHVAVTDIDCVSGETLMQLVVRWKMFVYQTQEITCYVCLDTLAERRVKPNDVALPILRVFCGACFMYSSL
jgi:phosphoribulokinase